jgi:hypothetical protein
MSWDFETEPEFQAKLDWAGAFVRSEVEPLDLLWPDLVFTPPDETMRKVIDPLKQAVRPRACGPRTSGRSWAARDTASSSCACSTRSWDGRAGHR